MRRIMIIGGPGSGKSTLARDLGKHFGLPVYHMDREVHWLPGWIEREPSEKLPLVQAIVAREAWVFEGGHSTSYDLRLARAEMLIWLDTPVYLRLWRVIRRSATQRGRSRPDLQEGCTEELRMLPEFLAFILRVRRRSRLRQKSLYDRAEIPKYRLRSLREVRAFLRDL